MTEVETLTSEIMEKMEVLKNRLGQIEDEPVGDGKAIFLSDMSEQEFSDYERNHLNGWGKVLNKLGIK